MKRRRDAPRTRINRGVKKGRMIVLKVLKEWRKKVKKCKGRIVVLFFKVEKEENLVVSRWTELRKRNQLSEGGSEWRKVL